MFYEFNDYLSFGNERKDNNVIIDITSFNLDDEHEICKKVQSLSIYLLENFETVYIYDKDIGRGAFLGGLIFGFIENLRPEQILSDYIRDNIKIPAKYIKMIKSMLKPYHFSTTKHFLSNSSNYCIVSSRFNRTFEIGECLFQCYKESNIDSYKFIKQMEKLSKTKTVKTAKKIGDEIECRMDWEETLENGHTMKFHNMVEVLMDKINSNMVLWNKLYDEEIRLRPVFEHTEDVEWGDGKDYTGKNMMGCAWKVAILTYLKNRDVENMMEEWKIK